VVGSVFVVRHDDSTAQLRMLYVDASARGLGIGQRLVDECLRFARDAGYTRMMLWTMSALTDARRLYQKAGFELEEEEPTLSFGKALVSQTWATVARSTGVEFARPLTSRRAMTITRVSTSRACSRGKASARKRTQSGQVRNETM